MLVVINRGWVTSLACASKDVHNNQRALNKNFTRACVHLPHPNSKPKDIHFSLWGGVVEDK